MQRKMMLYMPDDVFFRLKAMALERGKSMASLVRDALVSYLGQDTRVDHFRFVGIARGPRPHNISERADEIVQGSD